jgi:hypothetical protein
MDTEGQDVPLLSALPLTIDSIKVFPFVIRLQRDVIVRRQNTISSLCASNFFCLTFPGTGTIL